LSDSKIMLFAFLTGQVSLARSRKPSREYVG